MPVTAGFRRIFGLALVLALLATVFSTGAAAQSSLQVPLQFDFLNPGARSLALGSAFVGLADDATSAFTNPAGLSILRFPEVSFEGRYRRIESPFLQSGRLSGTVTNQGVDTIPNGVYGISVCQRRRAFLFFVRVSASQFCFRGLSARARPIGPELRGAGRLPRNQPS